MRTTLDVDSDLLTAAKQQAAATGRTLTAFIEDALREVLARRPERGRARYVVRPYRGTGLRPGVDLDDSSALLDVMDEA